MWITRLVFNTFFILIILKFTAASRYNISLSDLISCKEYRIQEGYVYRNFFLIENLQNVRTANETLKLKFFVMAQSNAHILLSPVNNAKRNDRVYEIVIGAGSYPNSFAAIRRNIAGTQVTTRKQNGILNAIDPTPLEIRQKIGGEIELTIPGFVGPYLTYKDERPLHIKYISFSTYGKTPARWFYDCDGDKAAHLEMEKRNLTDLERLEQHLFANYSSYTIPDNLRKVNLSFAVKGVAFDAIKSIFKTRLELKLKWHDPKLIWNATNFGKISVMKSSEINYWTPSLMIANGAGSTWTEFSPTYFGTVHSNGSVEVYAQQHITETWCTEHSFDWPWDNLRCSIDFAVHGDELQLVSDLDEPIQLHRMTESPEWRVIDYQIITETVNKETLEMSEKSDPLTTDLSLKLSMKRNSLFYRRVFYSPLVVSAVLILFSFILSGFQRGILTLIALILLLIGFVVLSHHTPISYVPKITHIYELFIGMVCFSYYLYVISRWLTDYPPECEPPTCIMTIINFSPLRYVLLMQFIDSEEYLNIQKFPWREVATMFDRIIMITMAIVFAIVSCIAY